MLSSSRTMSWLRVLMKRRVLFWTISPASGPGSSCKLPARNSQATLTRYHYIGGIVLNFHVMLSLQEDEDVVISLTSRNPQQITDTVTFDYNHRAFVPKTLRYSYDKK